MAIVATESKVRYEEFELQIKQSDQASPQNHECYVFEWLDNGHGKGNMSCLKVPELEQRPPCPLRIVLAPLDYPNNEIGHDILALYKHYSIPGAFVSERLRNVACSFGTTYGQDGVSYCWFHFLCKNVPIEDRNGVKEIVNQNHSEDYEETIIPNADFSWWRSAYCLITKPEGPNQEPSEVTLLSFGPELLLLNRLKDISKRASGQEILKDPYSLFNVVFEVLYERMDILTWNIADVFSYYEMKILKLAAKDPDVRGLKLDGPGLHMVQRHQIYMREAIEAITVTLDAMIEHHKQTMAPSFSDATQAEFRYRKILIKSTDLRLRSMENRTQNLINMSFNLVTRSDSEIMKNDSGSMRRIALLTMIFLPCTAVASFFSTPFFYLKDRGALGISPYFWIVWAVSLPLTLLTTFLLFRWSQDGKGLRKFLVRRNQRVLSDDE